jgi:hypothetical protein
MQDLRGLRCLRRSHAAWAARKAGDDPPTESFSAKLCFTFGVGYHIIVKPAASFPACFRMERWGTWIATICVGHRGRRTIVRVIQLRTQRSLPPRTFDGFPSDFLATTVELPFCVQLLLLWRSSRNSWQFHVSQSATTPAPDPDGRVIPHSRGGCVHLPSRLWL